MQLSDLTSKTPEELNVMCAEALGWSQAETEVPVTCYPGGLQKRKMLCWFGPNDSLRVIPLRTQDIPNYTGSWDAIMLEVRKLNMKQSFDLIEHLRAVLDIKATGDYAYTWLMLTATEKQLTIALILALTSQH